MSRKSRFILAFVVLAGLLGYRYWRDQRAPDAIEPEPNALRVD